MSVAVRMRLLVAVTLVGMAGLWLTALYILNDNLLEDRKEQTRRLVQSALGILEHHHKLMLAGTLSDAEARTAAKNALRSVRYGQNDYYFIFDAEHRYVINPPKPELEGQDKAALQDANGKYLVRELVATARAGGGFVDYAFPRAGESEAKPKLSYSAWFEPWGWALGTGIYIDDIDSAYRRTATLLGAMAAAILIGVGFLGLRTTHSILRQLGGEPAVARAAMHEMAAGNLVVSVGAPPPDSLLGELNTTASSLRDLVRLIEAEAATLVSHAAEINAASEDVTKAAADEADSTSAIAAAIEQLTVSSSQILDIARETEGNSQEAMSLALEGGDRVGKATQAIRSVSQTVTEASGRIEALETRAAEISTIANVIKEIAGQTNLLALNAAIEAARAGEQGRGFAVVADEVRKLAERTTDATSQIEAMLTAIQLDTNGAVQAMKEALPVVQQGVALASGAAESLHAIEGGARLALDRVHDVANATREQSAASTSIAQRVEQIARMVDETSVAVRNNGETAAGLEEIARRLQERVAHFKV